MATPNLSDTAPLALDDPAHAPWLRNLQGNILSGHGRDHTLHIFVRMPADVARAKAAIAGLLPHLTSAHKQEQERRQFKDFGIPGRLFATLHLSANGYRKLGVGAAALAQGFADQPAAQLPRDPRSNFLDGMAAHAPSDLGDPPAFNWEAGYRGGDIDAMLLLADDDAGFLAREGRRFIDQLQSACEIACVEHGAALRTDEGEGIEHFGYVDGRSQPLFLSSDFEGLESGGFGPGTREKDGGAINVWQPFEPLKLVLVKDELAPPGPDACFGSYLVFRKLEQNVRDFVVAEQKLADQLGLQGRDRARAGAMAVGRFRDGTPVAISQTDGLAPPKENNFRYDQPGPQGDRDGLKCPFHAHIRKTNPRGDTPARFGVLEESERGHRIARRGIPYGTRNRHPNAFNALDDLPAEGVGLLFMCYQASIRSQFAFMQRGWANNQDFLLPGAGIDPLIGQLDSATPGGPALAAAAQTWRKQFGQTAPTAEFNFGNFVKMKGGEFFFTPSIPYLASLA